MNVVHCSIHERCLGSVKGGRSSSGIATTHFNADLINICLGVMDANAHSSQCDKVTWKLQFASEDAWKGQDVEDQ